MSHVRNALSVANKFGLSNKLISTYHQLTGNLQNIHPDDRIRSYEPTSPIDDKQVLFPIIPGYIPQRLYYSVLGHAFRVRGYQPIFLYDDDDLPAKIGGSIDTDNKKVDTDIRKFRTQQVLKSFGFEAYSIGELLSPEQKASISSAKKSDELLQMSDYTDKTIEEYVKASVKKYLKIYRLDLSNPIEHSLYIEFLQSAIMILYSCQEVLKRGLKSIIVSEESYIQGGIPLEVGQSANIDVYTFSPGYRRGQIMFGRARNASPSHNFCSKDLITDVVKAELSKSERKTVTELMKKRQQNKYTNVMQNGKEYDSKKSTTVGIFSHLLWDAALELDDGLYSDFYVWLKDTISAGANMDEIEFVIKAHPAEETRGSNEPIVDWLTDHYDPLPNNFSFLPPDTDVDTYQLYNQIDAGVVFSSTVGLEMAYNGIPVVVGGFPPYHGCGITITPNTKTEYKQSIHEITTLDCSDEMQKRAARFCYFLFECQHINFLHNYTGAEMSRSKKGVMIEHDKVAREDSIYQKIVRQILNGEEVLDPNCRIGYTKE